MRNGGLLLGLLILCTGCESSDGVSRTKTAAGTNKSSVIPRKEQAALLVASNSELDFGVLPKGGSKELAITLHNPTGTGVEVKQVKTSCDCFSVTLASNVIESGATVKALVRVDFSDDPKFAGDLLLDAMGLVEGKTDPGFVLYARVSVSGTTSVDQ